MLLPMLLLSRLLFISLSGSNHLSPFINSFIEGPAKHTAVHQSHLLIVNPYLPAGLLSLYTRYSMHA